MNRTQLVISTAAFAAAALAAGVAEARGRDDVQWSVTIGSPAPAVWVAPPSYVVRPPVVVAPAPRYYAPAPAYYGPAPVYYAPAPVYQHRWRHLPRWDRDGDGIPNRVDRVYNPRWDRDGDGVPNRYDRHDHRGYR